MRTLALVALWGAVATAAPAQYTSIRRCGIHELQGLLQKDRLGKNTVSLVVNPSTESEFAIFLGDFEAAKHKKYVNRPIAALVGVYHRCSGECAGRLVKVQKRLEPWQHPAVYLDRKEPLKEAVECRKE